MAVLNWDSSLSVKIDSIDEEHKELIRIINEFYDNLRKSTNNELIISLIGGLKAYTITHFKTEENYMEQFKYPDYELHKKEHDDFIFKVSALEKKISEGKTIVSFEVTSYIKDWIKNHIQKSDKKYSDFFISNGIK
ncbi:MAG TPA: hemerythrin [Bacteroidales bacterium]|nr:hemerythrin [Bacteroidales bacterium]